MKACDKTRSAPMVEREGWSLAGVKLLQWWSGLLVLIPSRQRSLRGATERSSPSLLRGATGPTLHAREVTMRIRVLTTSVASSLSVVSSLSQQQSIRSGARTFRRNVCRRNVLSAKCVSVKCPVGEMSVGEMSVGKMSVGEMS